MRKVLPILAVILMLGSCSKDDGEFNGFNEHEKEVLNVLSGTWLCEKSIGGNVYSTEEITFSPFDAPTSIAPPSDSYASMELDGTMYHSYTYGDFNNTENLYFSINVEESTITTFGIGSNNSWALNAGGKYRYNIVNDNTITLQDTDSSSYLEDTFTKR